MNRIGRRALIGGALLAGAVVTQLASRLAPSAVEAVYARGLYPWFAVGLGHLSSLVPFSVGEVLVVGLGLFLALAIGRTLLGLARGRSRGGRVLGRAAAGALLVAGLGYWVFLLVWGFNYARQPLAGTIGLSIRPEPATELAELGLELVRQSNREREGLPQDSAGVLRIERGLGGVADRVELGYAVAARTYPVLGGASARPKPVFFSPVLSRLGIAGVFFPFTGEPNVNTTLPDVELPFSTAHELAHQRGFAREDEANYLGYLTCRLHPDADFRYSGLLAASHYALAALRHVDPAAAERVDSTRSAAVRRDEHALQAWADRYRSRGTEIGRRVNDAYLRTQGQAEGVRSYGRMVDLLLAERRTDAIVKARR